MPVDPFAEAKRLVSVRDAAHFYGLRFDSKDKNCLCPFHNDNHPSMSFTEDGKYWRCWVCGTGGSVIDLVMQLHGLDKTDALKRLIADFRLPLSVGGKQSNEERRKAREAWKERQRAAEVRSALAGWIDAETQRQADNYYIGHSALKGLSTPEDIDRLTPEQVRAIWNMPNAEYLANELASGDAEKADSIRKILR